MDEQRAVLEFLADPGTYGDEASEVLRVDTHASVVFLVGSRAYKLKRAVHYPYLDFSSLEQRRRSCEAEVQLNRRTAPDLYLGVIPVTRQASGRLALGGDGAPVEWLVQMARFDQADLLDRVAARGALDERLMPPLAREVAALHAAAEPRPEYGGRDGIAWVIDGNERGFAEQGAGILSPEACTRLTVNARRELDLQSDLLERRRRDGFVRVCHGDLHLRNIVLLDGHPTLFDGVEFNDRISCIDVLYDLAFLLMDLWRRELPGHANLVLNGYLEQAGQLEALALLPLFLSCRAAVRAMTGATAVRLQQDARRARAQEALAREYLQQAEQFLRPRPAGLVAVGGLSGSGKSTLARALGPGLGRAPGAVVLRSDVLRKQLLGASPTEPLGAEGYAASVTARVYRTLCARAGEALRAGQTVVADAVFDDPRRRALVEDTARASGARFAGLWLEAPTELLADRLRRRRGDASDATVEVLAEQQRRDHGLVSWASIDASGDGPAVRERALRQLAATGLVES